MAFATDNSTGHRWSCGQRLAQNMHFLDYFSDDYESARRKFLDAVAAYGLEHQAFLNPQRGPEGQTLSTDVAWFGDKTAHRILVLISGTHGVEFLAGSGCQIG